MADYKDLPPPFGRQDNVLSHDEADGTWSKATAAHIRGWDATDGAWNRVPVDHATGALSVKATLAAGSVDIGIVDQGTGGASAWKVTDAALVDGSQKTKLLDSGGSNIAAISAAGRLSVDASGVAVPVTDNGSSLTVDAPVGTPVWVRESDGAAAFVGQKTMANSKPVVIASDQSAIPVTMASQTPDVTDRAAREVGRVRLWDGTDEATVTPIRTLPASTEKTLNVREIPNRLSTFAVAIATQTPAITIGVKELLSLWHANTGAKDIYIVELWATFVVTTAATAGRTAVRVSNITTAPTGGTELTKLDIVQGGTSDMTNAMQVKTGGGAVGTTFIRKLAEWATQTVGRVEIPLFNASNPGNGIILPAGSSAGISIDIEREVAHTALVDLWTVGARWLEI